MVSKLFSVFNNNPHHKRISKLQNGKRRYTEDMELKCDPWYEKQMRTLDKA